jgi:hypothetical protein
MKKTKLTVITMLALLTLNQTKSFSQNESTKKDSVFNTSQKVQIIKGRLIDEASKSPIPFAAVAVVSTVPQIGTQTDDEGNFKLTNVPLGRQTLKVTFIGYEPLQIPDIMVTAGKEVILNLSLTEAISKLDEVVVSYDRKTDPTVTNNDMATVSSRSFNLDDTKKYAGALGDPSRMAANFAGVIAGNDSRNDIVVRGNTPNAMLWQLEGLNIPNPNHFGSNFNTGGPVSMLNSNNLAKSDFFSGAFPAQYGNANGGVFDLRLREGNNEKHEFLGQIGFNGFEIGAEGPLSKNSKASYLINYRYSTLGLFKTLGIDFGTGGATPLYQDLNFKITIPTKGNGKFTVFGLGGVSAIDLLGSEVDTTATNFYGSKNENTYPRFRSAIGGVSYEKSITDKTWMKLTLGASQSYNDYRTDSISLINKNIILGAQGAFTDNKYSAVFMLTHKFNAKNSLVAGVNHDFTQFDYVNKDFPTINSEIVRVKQKGELNLTQGYVQWKHRFTNKFSANVGLHSQYFDINQQAVIEPRLGLKLALGAKSSINLGYGLHHQTLPTYNLFLQNSNGIQTNKNLDFTRSNHVVLGFESNIAKNIKFKIETYYQAIDQVPVTNYSSTFSALNTGASFNPDDQADLVNKGTGTNYGAEITLERFFNKGFYFLITGSVFDSKYKGSDKIERNTAFNTKYAANALAGKEFKLGKKGSVLYANIKGTTLGGKYFTPLDFAASKQAGIAVFDDTKAFSEQQTPYFRIDVKIGYRKDFKKSSFEIAVDLQNVSNNKNIFAQGYNPYSNTISYEYQQGFFPVPMLKFTF